MLGFSGDPPESGRSLGPGMLKMGVDGPEVWALHVWSGEHFPGLPGSQIVPGKEEQGPGTQDRWGKAEAERPGELFFLQRQPAGCRETYGPTRLLPRQISQDP